LARRTNTMPTTEAQVFIQDVKADFCVHTGATYTAKHGGNDFATWEACWNPTRIGRHVEVEWRQGGRQSRARACDTPTPNQGQEQGHDDRHQRLRELIPTMLDRIKRAATASQTQASRSLGESMLRR